MENILVIKLSAFGDFMIAVGHFQAIKRYHPDARLTLLTTKAYKGLAEKSGLFDEVMIDKRPHRFDLAGWSSLRKEIRSRNFTRIYDLQNNDRTSLYYKIIWDVPFGIKGKIPQWVGTVKGCDFYTPDMRQEPIHAFDRGNLVLAKAGIYDVQPANLEWMHADVSNLNLPEENMVLIIPGAAPSRPEKKWPVENYIHVIKELHGKGFNPVVVGSHPEVPVVERIKIECPYVVDLTCKTNFYELAEVSRKAQFAIGNDTGPMHLLALTDLPMVVLFSKWSNPVQSSPLGNQVDYIQKDDMSAITVDEVLEKIYIYEQVPKA